MPGKMYKQNLHSVKALYCSLEFVRPWYSLTPAWLSFITWITLPEICFDLNFGLKFLTCRKKMVLQTDWGSKFHHCWIMWDRKNNSSTKHFFPLTLLSYSYRLNYSLKQLKSFSRDPSRFKTFLHEQRWLKSKEVLPSTMSFRNGTERAVCNS